MSLFPISKRLTFFGLFRICSFQGTCSLRLREALDWCFISHQETELLFNPLITGKTSYHNSTSLLTGLTPVSRSSSFTVLFPTELPYWCLFLYEQAFHLFFSLIRRPPALPHRLQCSTIGRLRLNRRVRDGNGCFPQAHRHRKCSLSAFLYQVSHLITQQ